MKTDCADKRQVGGKWYAIVLSFCILPKEKYTWTKVNQHFSHDLQSDLQTAEQQLQQKHEPVVH